MFWSGVVVSQRFSSREAATTERRQRKARGRNFGFVLHWRGGGGAKSSGATKSRKRSFSVLVLHEVPGSFSRRAAPGFSACYSLLRPMEGPSSLQESVRPMSESLPAASQRKLLTGGKDSASSVRSGTTRFLRNLPLVALFASCSCSRLHRSIAVWTELLLTVW